VDITPVEIREKRFKSRVMGYGQEEVNAFLSMVADGFEEVMREVDALRGEVKRLTSDLELYREREESIRKTIMTTQKLCEDMKRNAEKECQIILSEAELKAEKFVAEAQQRVAQIANEMAEMKRQKIQFEESLRSILGTHLKLLDISKEEAQ
jgi:cell division initiation protein